MAPKPANPNQDAFDRALRSVQDAEKQHSEFVEKVEARYKAYRGILDKQKDVQDWASQAHPPYIMHIVETTLASLIEDKLNYRIRPRLTMDMLQDPQAADRARLGAKAHQILFDWQLQRDHFSEIQRPFNLQHAIAGLTVAKTYWVSDTQTRRHLKPVEETVLGPDGFTVVGTITKLEEAESDFVVYDGPTTEVRDVRDFLWHEAATELKTARYVCDRVWKGLEDIEEGLKGDDPVFGTGKGGWDGAEILKLLTAKESDGEARAESFKDMFGTREQEIFNVDRTKDLIEVIEVWDNTTKMVTTIANRKVLLSHRPFPFWHNQPPFVVCSTQPDLFRIPGISQVEKVAHLQDMLWEIQNQSISNLRLINNAIFMFPYDIEDVDLYDFEPGARWPIEDPQAVQMWTPSAIPAEVSQGREGLLKGDLQNLAGGFPFASGTDSQTVDQKTATGASLVSSLAQRSVNLAKQQVTQAWGRVGEQRMRLNMQFVREPEVVPVVGLGGQDSIHIVEPMLLHGDFDFIAEPSSDALMKQEDQAAAQALLQLAMAAAPISAQLALAGAGKMINFDAFVEDALHAFGKDDVDRYFTNAKPSPLQQNSQQPGAPDQGGGGGITASQSVDPAVSPSASISQAPSTLVQRALASTGGGQNVPHP